MEEVSDTSASRDYDLVSPLLGYGIPQILTSIRLLPIASIFTPATLTVETVSETSYNWFNVSSVDFTSRNFASFVKGSGAIFNNGCEYSYTGPLFEVQKVATAASGQGAVLPISVPGNQPNVSYNQHFAGPALQCSHVVDPLRGQILFNVNSSSWDTTNSFGYLSWVPNETGSLPFDRVNESDWQLQLQGAELSNGRPLALFVATFPTIDNFSKLAMAGEQTLSEARESWLNHNPTANATILECRLINATYSASYN